MQLNTCLHKLLSNTLYVDTLYVDTLSPLIRMKTIAITYYGSFMRTRDKECEAYEAQHSYHNACK